MVKLTEEQKAELAALEKLSDNEIDFSDIPELPIDWSKARVGLHYKPDWQDITLRLDQNVIDWLEEQADSPERGPQGHQPSPYGAHLVHQVSGPDTARDSGDKTQNNRGVHR